MNFALLTPSVPVYENIVLKNPALSCYFCAILQLHSLPDDCARELFKCSKDLACLPVKNPSFRVSFTQV